MFFFSKGKEEGVCSINKKKTQVPPCLLDQSFSYSHPVLPYRLVRFESKAYLIFSEPPQKGWGIMFVHRHLPPCGLSTITIVSISVTAALQRGRGIGVVDAVVSVAVCNMMY